jgi:uncharacterized protein (TIGR03435 family)
MTKPRLRVSVLFYLLTFSLTAQTVPQPTFDIASVKPNKTGSRSSNSNFPLGPGDAYTTNGGYFSATNYPLVTYIAFAYRIMGDRAPAFLKQLPAWVTEERYDIQARAQGNPTKDQMRRMMRSLLAERFKLAMHEETGEVSMAELVAAKEGRLGPNLQRHPANSSCPLDADPSVAAPDDRFPLLCGGIVGMPPNTAGRIRLGARNVTMEFIAKSLSGGAGSERPLLDRTGLGGSFDFSLEWTPEIRGPRQAGNGSSVRPVGPHVRAGAAGATRAQAGGEEGLAIGSPARPCRAPVGELTGGIRPLP